jgi:hypothetical protein
MMIPKKPLNTSTFTDFNSCQTLETNGSIMSNSSNGKRTISLNSQVSPKQVRFGYLHMNTTIQQFRTGTTTNISYNKTHDTFI